MQELTSAKLSTQCFLFLTRWTKRFMTLKTIIPTPRKSHILKEEAEEKEKETILLQPVIPSPQMSQILQSDIYLSKAPPRSS